MRRAAILIALALGACGPTAAYGKYEALEVRCEQGVTERDIYAAAARVLFAARVSAIIDYHAGLLATAYEAVPSPSDDYSRTEASHRIRIHVNDGTFNVYIDCRGCLRGRRMAQWIELIGSLADRIQVAATNRARARAGVKPVEKEDD